jgi:hypothetical protein
VHRKDGEWIHIRQVIEPLSAHPASGKDGRWFSTLQDVTALKRAQT